MKFSTLNFNDQLKKNERVVAVNLKGGSVTLPSGVVIRDGEVFKVLGYFASICRLSRVSDCAKAGLIPSINLLREADYKVELKAHILEGLKNVAVKSKSCI
jgi:hypothetical protein